MKAKLIESTNKMLSIGFSGREGKLILNGNAIWVNTPFFLDGLISVITLPETMDKCTAEEYILKHNVRDDAEGCLIMSLQKPLD